MAKKAAAILTTASLVAAIAACSNSKEGSNSANSSSPAATTAATKAAPTDISITTLAFNPAPTGELEGVKKIDEKLNVNLKINYIPSNTITDKLNVLLATNDLPDVLFLEDFAYTPSYLNAVDQGAFWDLTPYVKQYPNLAKYPDNVYLNASVKGKLWTLPRVRPLDGHEALLYRKDWLDKLGLQVPKTVDDLAKVLEAFATKDPDGNGKADTYGAVIAANNTNIIQMFGAGINWKEENGSLIPYWWTQQAKDALVYWNKLYKVGGMMPDYPLLKAGQNKEMLVEGKAGVAMGNVSDAYTYDVELKKTNPQGNIIAAALPQAPDGKQYYNQSTGSYGQFLINKKTVNEAKLKKILEVFDYTATEEGYNLAAFGIKDVDYTEKLEGIIEQTDAGKQKGYSAGTTDQWLTGYFDKYKRAKAPGMPNDVYEQNKKLIDSIVSIPDPTYGVAKSAPYKEKGADWDKKINDMIVNVIIGKSSLEDWDKFVQQFKSDPSFQQHVKETNDGYKEKMKK